MTTCSAMMQQIVTMPQPVIAAVQAIAAAAGEASQCGLSYSISGCARTADIPAGYAGAHESLAGKFWNFR
jgi:enoyl-CoA hydratase/carnithine racemase